MQWVNKYILVVYECWYCPSLFFYNILQKYKAIFYIAIPISYHKHPSILKQLKLLPNGLKQVNFFPKVNLLPNEIYHYHLPFPPKTTFYWQQFILHFTVEGVRTFFLGSSSFFPHSHLKNQRKEAQKQVMDQSRGQF